jgi:hypothetical protein
MQHAAVQIADQLEITVFGFFKAIVAQSVALHLFIQLKGFAGPL